MKKLSIIVFIVLFLCSMSITEVMARGKGGGSSYRSTGSTGHRSSSRGSTVSVKGYTKSNGTYVAPHNRTAPNRTKGDNWSTKGNVNPYTGKMGTKEP